MINSKSYIWSVNPIYPGIIFVAEPGGGGGGEGWGELKLWQWDLVGNYNIAMKFAQ